MSSVRIALLQSSGRLRDVSANLAELAGAAAEAAAAGADLLIAPELFLTGYAIGADVRALAEPVDGPSTGQVGRTAARNGIAVAYGYPELAPGGHLHNAAVIVGADGGVLANYRKTHLFGDFEREHFTPGDTGIVQAELAGLRVGLLICYDIEFPEPVRAHALAGTDLLVVPTAQMRPFEFVADTVIPARAWESQLYVAYVNRHGREEPFDFVGRSCLSGPDGTTRARAGAGRELLLADVDPVLLAGSRSANPYLVDRRPELYA
jgi:predicted amidohydrolase